MANKLISTFSNTKARTVLLFFGTLFIIGITVVITSFKTSEDPLSNRKSKSTKIAAGIDATPGAATSERYQELQSADNKKRAEAAETKGSSAISTIIGDKAKDQLRDSGLEEEFLKAFQPKKEVDPQLKLLLDQERLHQKEEERFRKQQAAALEAERLARSKDLRKKQVDAVLNAMDTQAKAMFQAWHDIPQQLFVQAGLGFDGNSENAANTTKASGNSSNTVEGTLIYKAGDILFGVLDTAVNSDEVSPILATIVHGPEKGSKLIGKFTKTNNSEKVILEFTLLNSKKYASSVPIKIVAIDPETARTALASDVNHHYLLRYGSLFASAFLEGYGNAIGQSGTTVTTNGAGNAATTTTTRPKLSGKQEFLAALGKVGQSWGSAINQNFNRPPTVKVDAGLSLGLLVLEDITIQ